jgi:uncharacterized protein
MVSLGEIQAFVDQVVARFRPSRIILFGSYAQGNPTPDSDVDLMVIMPHKGAPVDVATEIRLACPRSFAMDLIVQSPAQVRQRLAMGDSFLREVDSTGIVLHETSNARVG